MPTSDSRTLETSLAATFAPDPDEQRRADLAHFLKTKRASIAPEAIGILGSRRRRVSGLLREEVAHRAGISLTWYVWMEQGREMTPSSDVLENLADALLMTDAERDHLMMLARPDPSLGWTPEFTSEAPHDLQQWIAGLDQPAYVLNGRWDILAWNDAAAEMLADFAIVPERDRNILRMIFLWSDWQDLFLDWECLAASSVAQFRAETARYAGHSDIQSLTSDLSRDSNAFALLWNALGIDGPRLKTKRMLHPRHGELELSFAPLQLLGCPEDLSVIVYAPVVQASGGR